VDAAILALILVGTAVGRVHLTAFLGSKIAIAHDVISVMIVVAAVLAALPFFLGIVRVSRRLGLALAALALPTGIGDGLDLAAAPRRVLVVTLQLVCFLLVGAPLVALTQPFLKGYLAAELLLVALGFLGIAFWRTAADLYGHVRAGAQVVVEALATQSKSTVATPSHPSPSRPVDTLERLKGLMASFGAPAAITLDPESPAVGKTLAQLNVRAITGAIVLAITRHGESVLVPGSDERLRDGDVLAVAGTREAVHAAAALLTSHVEG
jgi:CPA2 family monovalent cation:H+ antiporter-2